MKPTGRKQLFKATALTGVLALCAMVNVFAAGPPPPSQLDNPLAVSLIVVAGALLLAIVMLGRLLINVAQIKAEREKEEKKNSIIPAKTLMVLLFCTISYISFSQNVAAPAQEAAASYGGLSAFSFYTIIGVIALEILVITAMLFSLKGLLAKEKIISVVAEEARAPKESIWKKWWAKINNFRPAHEEVDLGHDYDGIRELDNRLPPWWLYGFYICIVFAAVYLYRANVSHTAPSSQEEYFAAVAKADEEKAEYLKKAANKVDENSVTLLTDGAALGEGKKIFSSTCAPCHGPEGQGVVGPNLTDDYWLHKGGIKDIFKTIKYGVPEKGMKSWEADFSPVQLAEIASYIKSLHGTKPANPKEPQGDLYNEEAPVKDSVKVVGQAQAAN
ncbi:c-type cytochrome [Panacibacter ginsenosidivorans]|uniref:C-type cytochrome n=1 Tax=Panacibacter ginsenosidivorans TaxID=1813871 RepID=A0A5B8VIF5_9BACT|nr:cbb3-type cytochrome c oxidase N-terminal domain-containing protein [Panacibacter ginsenosidivorans]QEC70068.1 c-type cytochrome [Panacibacter ginsenosidivorans]